MADISKITLPSGNSYDIKDAVARSAIAGGIAFIVSWSGNEAPVVADIPEGVTVTYDGTSYTGTLPANDAQVGAFYLVKSSNEDNDVYDEYVPVGESGSKEWERLGTPTMDLSAYVKNVTLNKSSDVVLGEATTFTNASSSVSFTGGTTDVALGEATTFTNAASAVSFSGGTTDKVLGEATTFTNASSAVTFGTPTKESFVKSVTADTTKKLVTTSIPNVTGNSNVSIPNVTGNDDVSIPNVTSVGSASTWSFTVSDENLTIGGANSTAPTLGTALSASKVTLGTNLSASKVTLGTAITAATGAATTTGTGAAIVTDVTIGDSADAITALPTATAAAQTITVGTNDKVTAVTGIGTGTAAAQKITVGTNDKVTAVTGIGTATAAAQKITVGTNDKVTALKNDTSITVTH